MASVDLAGRWYLTGLEADEGRVPKHRVLLKFASVEGRLHGAAVALAGEEVPLGELTFDGRRLSFRLQRPTGDGFQAGTVMPYSLVFHAVAGEKFEGHWMKSKTETVGPKLKLWRAASKKASLTTPMLGGFPGGKTLR